MKRIIALGTLLGIMLVSLGGCGLSREAYQRPGWYEGDDRYYAHCTGVLPCKAGGGYPHGRVGE